MKYMNILVYRNVQPFFDALKKDVINHLLINNPESFNFLSRTVTEFIS